MDSAKHPEHQNLHSLETNLTDADLKVFRLFRDAYFNFMDSCSKLWQRHCEHLAELSAAASEQMKQMTEKSQPEELTAIASKVNATRREKADTSLSELHKAVARYADGMAIAWKAAAESKIPQATLWHVGVGQMNVAAEYAALVWWLRA